MNEILTGNRLAERMQDWDVLDDGTRTQWESLVTRINLPPMYKHAAGSTVDNFRPKEMAADIEADPVISGTIIAVANSAKIGLSSPIMTVDRAIVHLGFNLIVSIISSYQLQQALGSNSRVSREFLDLIRRWSATARTTALHFFKRASMHDANEDAPTVALLARLGTVILAMSEHPPHSNYITIPDEPGRLTHELKEYGITSPQLSGRLVRHWGLPDPIPQHVDNLWRPVLSELDDTPDNRCLTLLALSVNLADTYMNYSMVTPEEFLGRGAYAQLAANLEKMGLLGIINEAWESKLMQRELEAASY
ncbi:HDOD domain-containing protein [bacterium]|nr:HDOD domain-containing protein [bacterium]